MDAKQDKNTRGGKQAFFKRKADGFAEESSSLSSTEELNLEEDEFDESIFREECRQWIALNAKALFALESSRFLARQSKSHKVNPRLTRDGRMVTPLSQRD